MSLFNVQELWSNNDFGSSDELSPKGATLVSLLGNVEDQIVLGFNSGILRILDPKSGENESQGAILLEVKLDEPILEVAYGKFVGSNSSLAVLHPKGVHVFSPLQKTNNEETLKLELAYKHSIKNSCYSLTYGPFGGAKQRDYLCVQTLEGAIVVFEQETFGFSRNLSDRFILPTPIIYTQRTDSFIVFSSDFQLNSYKYQSLAIESNSESEGRTSESWRVDLSDEILDIQEIASSVSQQPNTIIALCMKNLFILYDTGIILFTKKLNFNPITLLIYPPPFNMDEEVKKTMIAIASDSKSLYLMENTTLKWISQLPFVPLRVFRGNFNSNGVIQRGLLSLISPNGTVNISYLGTNPSFFVAPPLEKENIDHKKYNEEYQRLNQVIENMNNDTSKEKKSHSLMTVETDESFQRCFYTTNYEDDDKIMLQIQLNISVSSTVQSVKVSFDTSGPFRIECRTTYIPEIENDTSIKAFVYLADLDYAPKSNHVSLRIMFFANQTPNYIKKDIYLPLILAWKPHSPVKDAAYKITLHTNGPSHIDIIDLFEQFVVDNTMTNAVGFVLGHSRGTKKVTILGSKSSQRYRVQSDDLSSLWIFVQEFQMRLKAKYGFNLIYNSAQLPLNDYINEIEQHTKKRQDYEKLEHSFAQQSSLFRAIEKRLLNRFKDKTPGQLTSLDTLLESTYRRVQKIVDLMESAERDLNVSSTKLSCITKTLHQLITLYPSSKKLELLPALADYHDNDWEERTDGVLGFYLGNPTTPFKDLNRLKKRIHQLIDRIMEENENVSINPRAPICVLGDEFDDIEIVT
ncbi:protein PTHB1 [Lepeophtheirus salmonis]|uniref:protein PTHB1 n=1 Tax=Lepeophtheirus salmonis TaxID=72036 RepID=UPI001AE37732|nr:protein PTHB1-like [Lepeophtheirus salmonis]